MRRLAFTLLVCVISTVALSGQAPGPVTAIRAGRLLDPEAGRILTNQVILVQERRITDVGPDVTVPAGAQVIDLSRLTVLPGLVDAHNHLALTYKPEPESNIYFVMKDGQVFKKDGVMTPAAFFHGGPVYGWRIR